MFRVLVHYVSGISISLLLIKTINPIYLIIITVVIVFEVNLKNKS